MVKFLKENKAIDYGTVLKAKEIANFIAMIKAVVCNVGSKSLSIAGELVPVLAELALEDNNINYWLRVGGRTAGNLGKNILEWTNNALVENSFCKEKIVDVPKVNEVTSLLKAELFLNHNNDNYLALDSCKSDDQEVNKFNELGSDWILCGTSGNPSTVEYEVFL